MLSRFKPAVRRSACPPRRPKPPAFRPGLELLESRDCPSYLPAVDLAVGPSPGAVATWQQDLSGPSALAVTHMADNRVSVVRGNADGTFQAPVAYAVGEAPHAIAAAVSNLTGRAVLVTANAGANSVSVLWENGDGTFQDAVHYAVGQAPGAVALGDLNWDGCFDIAVANAGDDTVSVLLGNANGTFQSARSYTVGSAPSSILLTWMNQPSLVVANAGDNTITVLQADFMGNLFASGTYQVGRNPQALAAGYFGGSGVGIAVANADDGTVSVLAGNWNGTLNEKVDHVVGGEPRALALVSSYTGSLLLVADAADHTVRRFSVQTDGSLQLEEVASVGQQPTALATLPLTFGNQLAIVVAHEEGDSVSLLSVPQFAVRPVSAVRAGEPFAVEISIRNALGQLVTDFAGSVVLRTSDPWAEPLATVNFSVADQGARVLDIAPLTVAGNQYLYLFTVEAGVETLQTTASVLVQPGPTVRLSLDHFGVPSAYAEQPFSLRVAGLDAFGNFDFNYTGTVTITSSDAPATLPVSVTFGPEHGGVQYVEVVFATTGAQTITISDTNGLTAALHLDVGPPLPTQLSIVAPNQVEAGETFALTVTLLDRFGQPATDFTGTVWISSSDWLAFPAQPYTFTAADQGMHTFEGLVLQVAGWQQVSASFGVDAVFLQASATVVVAALPATRFNVQSVGTVQVGQPALFGLSAQDLFGNIDANYAGTVWLTGDAPDAQLPAELELSPADGGARTFEITFATAGTHTLTVTDAHGLTGSLTVTVAGMPAERIEFALPSQVRAGETFEFTVSIVDALGRVVPDFLGFVMFTSETSRAELPDSYTFTETDQGRHTFSARLNQAGQATVNVMGLGEQWLMASATVAVLPGPVVGLEVVGMPARLSVGQLGEIAVRAVDAGGNTVTDYVGTIAFTSSDPLAQLPPPYTFTVGDQGRHTFVVSLFSQSAQRVGFTTTDGFSWEQTAIQVTPDPTNFAADRLATALPVPFGPSGIVSLSGHLATGRDVLLYALDLQAGETITAAIDTQAPASALDGVLRVFDASGRCLASNDNLVGKDARLTFQAATTGTFYVGVSSSGNREYDPTLAQSGALGTTTGGFTLHLTRDLAPLLPDLVGTSCAIREPAVWGETIIVDYLLENRGGSDAGPFRVDVRLSADNRIDATDMLLGSFSVGGLAAGTASNGSLQLRLPADGAGRFPEAGRFFVGLALDADNSVVELDERNNSSQTLGNDQALLTVFAIAPESTAGQPTVLPSLARVDGQLAAGAADWYALDLTESGRLRVQVGAVGANVQLALFDAAGRAIVQTNDGRIDLHLNLEPGQGQRFWFRVTGLGGAGSYRLTSTFEASGAALSTLRGLGGQLLGGDFNNDGIADILAHGQEGAAQPLARLLLGLGDGTFREAGAAFEVGHNLAAGDFDGDGRLDLLYTRMQPWGSVLCVQLGRGDGTFAAALETPQVSMGFASAAATGDFNRDGWLDVVCDQAIYLGRGDGTFAAAQTLGTSPVFAMLAADFNGDGWLDLVQALQGGGLAVLLGRGDGSFEAPLLSATGLPFGATGLQAGDVNRDGWLDLLAGQTNTGDFPVFLGRGNGTFADPVRLAGGGVLGYFDRDAQLDLLGPDTLQVGRGDGSFRAVGPFSAPTGGDALAGDWNRDGILDLAVGMAGAINVTTGQISPSSLNVLLGAADGSWTTTSDAARLPVPASSVVAADVDRDGFLDLLYASGDYNPFSPSRAPATLHTQRGGGDGSFSPLAALPIAGYPQALIPHDFNGDGRLDVAALNVTYLGDTSDLSVYLGVGDGSFAEVQRVSLGSRFRATDIAAGDFNGDGRLDLVVAVTEFPSPDNFFAPIRTTVRLLLGNADGTFHEALSWQPALDFPVFTASEVFAGDVNGDRRLDVVVVGWSQVAVFLGNGDGTFQEQRDTPRDQGAPVALTGDFNGDGRLDLLGRGVGNRWNIQTGNADGTFQTAFWISPELDSDRLFTPTDGQAAVGDFNRDGHLDLAGVRDADGRLFLLLGQGDGTFELQTMPDAGGYVRQLLVVDANRDGRADLTCLLQDGRVLTLLGNGDGQFVSAEEIPQHAAAPGLADFNGDGAVDVVTLTERGELLYRQARPREPGAFEPARLVNAGQPVRAFAIVQGSTGPLLAAIRTDGAGVVLYRRTASGGFSVAQELPVGDFPTLIVAGNYSGTPNGRADDFAVYNALSGTVSLFIVGAGGRYGAAQTFAVGAGMTALTIAPGTHGRDELILADRSGAQVLVLANDGQGNLGEPQRWRAGDGLYTWQASRADVQSRLATSLLAVGQFTADGVSDLVAVSTGQLGLLAGGANGGWHDPRLTALTFGASALAIGRFDGDAYADVALLDAENGTIRVFLGDGRGGFVERVQAAPLLAGNATTGLTARDLDGDGRLDLLVGNTYGDLLVLPGNGDGTFRPYQRATGTVALAVADLDGDGRDDFVLGNAALDRVSIQFGGQAPGVLQGRAEGILAPTAVKLADLNGDGIADLAVANSGGNNVLIYLGLGGGAFAAPRSYFAGTTPVALYVATLDNGDALPDLVVVNQGSNDISVLFGQGTGADWTLTYGPRLRSGGVGPNSAVIRDVTGDGVQDIVATNGASNIVAVLTGSGQGFFNDISPLLLNTGAGPVQVLVGNFDGRGGLDLISVNRQAGNLTFFAGFGPGRTIGTGGQAAVAVSADFNGDGLTDLLVANQGGTLAFLLGGLGGPGIAELLSAAPLDHPSALVLAGADGKTINIYATNEGDDRVFRFTLEPDLQPVQGDLTPLQGAQAASVASLIVGQHPLDEYRLPEQATGPAAGFEGLVAGLPSSLPGTTAPTEGTTGSESFDLAPGDSTLPMLQRWLDATLGQPTWLEFEDAVFEALQVAWDAVRGQAREQWDRLAPPWRDLIESLWQAVSGARANRSPANGSAGLEESGCGFPQAPFNEWELFEQSSADVSVNDLASDDLLPPCEEVTTMAQAVDRLRRHASGESNSDCLLYVCFTAVICEHVSPPAERRHGRRKSPAPNESSAA